MKTFSSLDTESKSGMLAGLGRRPAGGWGGRREQEHLPGCVCGCASSGRRSCWRPCHSRGTGRDAHLQRRQETYISLNDNTVAGIKWPFIAKFYITTVSISKPSMNERWVLAPPRLSPFKTLKRVCECKVPLRPCDLPYCTTGALHFSSCHHHEPMVWTCGVQVRSEWFGQDGLNPMRDI